MQQHVVFLLVAVAGMRQSVGQCAVISEQHQAFAISVQSPDGVKPAGRIDQFAHARASRVRVEARFDPTGFVQQNVGEFFGQINIAVVQRDAVVGGVGAVSERGRLPVDVYPPGRNQSLTRAAGAVAGAGQYFLQAFSRHFRETASVGSPAGRLIPELVRRQWRAPVLPARAEAVRAATPGRNAAKRRRWCRKE